MYEIPEQLIIEQVLRYMQNLNMPPRADTPLIADGQLHRYAIDGDKAGSKNGAYRIHTDGVPAWYIKDWKSGAEATGRFDDTGLLGADKDIYAKRISDKSYMDSVRIRRETLEQEERKKKQKATENAKALYEQAKPATPEHEYLKRKGITDISDFRTDTDGAVLIPLYDVRTGEFNSYQKISPTGDKRFAKDTGMTGACYTFEPENADMRIHFVAEGIATGETIYRLTGRKWPVTCAMNCHSLLEITKALKERNPRTVFLVGADNDLGTYAKTGDNPGRNRAEFVVRAGYAKGIIIPDFQPNQDGSDWNDYELLHGQDKARAEFERQLNAVLSSGGKAEQSPNEQAEQGENTLVIASRETFEREAAAYALNDFIARVESNRERPIISTGFSNLDKLLDGGLWPGLYFIGAISSVGKTTLMLQIADNVARSGYGVLIISLEMARNELIAKSLSRLTFIESLNKYNTREHAKTTHGILRGCYTAKEQELIRDAISSYGDFGRKIHIIEGVADLGTDVIRAKAEEYIKHTGSSPVIMIDYAQILAAPKVRRSLTDKQVVDMNVTELKRISRDYDTPVIAISSFNRDSYSAPVSMSSFKESGAIEYSSDVLIGIQYYGWDYQDGEKSDKDGTRAKRLRALKEKNRAAGKALGSQDMQVVLLKYRNYPQGSCRMDFFPAFNYWRESLSV